jgi:hypothetical protein
MNNRIGALIILIVATSSILSGIMPAFANSTRPATTISNTIRVEPSPILKNIPMGMQSIVKFNSVVEYESQLLLIDKSPLAEVKTQSKSYTGNYNLYYVQVGLECTVKPSVLMITGLHAQNEWELTHVMLNFINKVINVKDNQVQTNKYILDRVCLVFIPMANPYGYFASKDGVHHNGHGADVKNAELINWHDNSEYDYYYGVNLNRNFDMNFNEFVDLPFSVQSYWNGIDYGYANYFMMPYTLTGEKDTVSDNIPRQLKPDADTYDYKGEAPFSEPETQLVRDLFTKYKIKSFYDWHKMNPWQNNNSSVVPNQYYAEVTPLITDALKKVELRNQGANILDTNFIKMDTYAGNGPYAQNWGVNKMGAKGFGWEMGNNFPVAIWTDAYIQIFYEGILWGIK